MLDFSEQLVNKIQNHKINPLIGYMIYTITFSLLGISVISGIKDNSILISIIIFITFLIGLSSILIRITQHINFNLDKVGDFLILNNNSINKSVKNHKKMLSIITNLHYHKRLFYSDKFITKFERLLDVEIE